MVSLCDTARMRDRERDLSMNAILKDRSLLVPLDRYICKFIILSLCLSPTLGVWFPCWSRPKTTRHSLAELYLPQLHHGVLSSTHSWNHWRGWESHRETRGKGCPHLTCWQGHRATGRVLRGREGETLWSSQAFSRTLSVEAQRVCGVRYSEND